MNLEQILQSGDMVLDPAELRYLLGEATRAAEVLEIWLDRDKRTFTSRLFPPPEEVAPPPNTLWITPLEPANGNIAIRQANQIRFLFHMGRYAVGGSIQFHKVETVGAARVLGMGMPSLLRIHLQRSNARYVVPRDRPCLVKASRRRELVLAGTLLDINLHGLGFEIANAETAFEKGETVSVEVQPTPFGIQTFKVYGTVCFKSRVREAEPDALVMDRYGVQLAQDGQYMLLRQLVEKLRRLNVA